MRYVQNILRAILLRLLRAHGYTLLDALDSTASDSGDTEAERRMLRELQWVLEGLILVGRRKARIL